MTNREVEVNLSMASLLPLSAFRSSRSAEETAKRIGCEGVEILPVRSVVCEVSRDGYLTAGGPSIKSLHQDWRRDEKAEREYHLSADTNRTFGARRKSWFIRHIFFPSEESCREAIEKLEATYSVPVVHHWPDDSRSFKRPILEVHPYLNKSPEQLIEWAEEDPQTRGLTLDVSQRKLGDYLDSQKMDRSQLAYMIEQLAPHIKEVHFQLATPGEFKQVIDGNYDASLGQIIALLKKTGFRGPYVIEVNPGIIAGIRGNFSVCRNAVNFLRTAA